MGVRRSDYILLGFEIKEHFDELEESKVDELFDKYYVPKRDVGDVVLLDDCYGGEYVYFGIILQVDKDGCDGLTPFVFDDDIPIEREKIEKAARYEFSIDSNAQLIVLTHWQ